MTDSPSQELRQAAKLMRERAEAATPGPWERPLDVRAIMRDMDDKPIALERYNPHAPGGRDTERTSAADRTIMDQWCVILLPLPDCVGVRAHLKFWGMGIWDQAELTDGGNKENLFVRYPEDPAQITGAEYETALREAVSKALAAVEADRAKSHA